MATYTGTKAQSNIPGRVGIREAPVVGSFTVSTALTTGDIINLAPIPAGAAMIDVVLDMPSLGSGTSATLSVGDNAQSYATTGQTNRLITSFSATVTGYISMTGIQGTQGSLGRFYTTADTVILNVGTGPQTGTTGGVLNYMVYYTQDK